MSPPTAAPSTLSSSLLFLFTAVVSWQCWASCVTLCHLVLLSETTGCAYAVSCMCVCVWQFLILKACFNKDGKGPNYYHITKIICPTSYKITSKYLKCKKKKKKLFQKLKHLILSVTDFPPCHCWCVIKIPRVTEAHFSVLFSTQIDPFPVGHKWRWNLTGIETPAGDKGNSTVM